MAQVTSRDHAYSPDAAALRAPTVPVSSACQSKNRAYVQMAVAPLPPSHIAPLPQSLTYTPPSSTFPTSASSSSVPPLSASSISTNFKFGTPPPISPTAGTGLFARRGSILPKVGETSKLTPSRSSRMEEEVEMGTVKPVVADEAKIKEEQAMAKWRVSPHLVTLQMALSKTEMGSRATTSSHSDQTDASTTTISSSTETTHDHQRFSRYITKPIPSKLRRLTFIPRPLRTLTQRSGRTQ